MNYLNPDVVLLSRNPNSPFEKDAFIWVIGMLKYSFMKNKPDIGIKSVGKYPFNIVIGVPNSSKNGSWVPVLFLNCEDDHVLRKNPDVISRKQLRGNIGSPVRIDDKNQELNRNCITDENFEGKIANLITILAGNAANAQKLTEEMNKLKTAYLANFSSKQEIPYPLNQEGVSALDWETFQKGLGDIVADSLFNGALFDPELQKIPVCINFSVVYSRYDKLFPGTTKTVTTLCELFTSGQPPPFTSNFAIWQKFMGDQINARRHGADIILWRKEVKIVNGEEKEMSIHYVVNRAFVEKETDVSNWHYNGETKELENFTATKFCEFFSRQRPITVFPFDLDGKKLQVDMHHENAAMALRTLCFEAMQEEYPQLNLVEKETFPFAPSYFYNIYDDDEFSMHLYFKLGFPLQNVQVMYGIQDRMKKMITFKKYPDLYSKEGTCLIDWKHLLSLRLPHTARYDNPKNPHILLSPEGKTHKLQLDMVLVHSPLLTEVDRPYLFFEKKTKKMSNFVHFEGISMGDAVTRCVKLNGIIATQYGIDMNFTPGPMTKGFIVATTSRKDCLFVKRQHKSGRNYCCIMNDCILLKCFAGRCSGMKQLFSNV